MRYALLTPTYLLHSGIDRAVEEQARELLSQGHNVKIFCFQGRPSMDSIPVLSWGMPKSTLMQRIYRLLFFIFKRRIRQYAEELREMDEVYSHFYPMSVIGLEAKKRFNKKFYYYDYGVPPISSFVGIIEKLYIILFKPLANFYAKRADNIITISKYLAQQYPERFQPKIRVEHIKIDRRRFQAGVKGNRIRSLYGLNNDPVILYVGRLSPHKGIHLLIKAFLICFKKFPKARLLIVGQSSFKKYKKELENTSNSNTIFTGFVPDGELPEYYAACTVYATASLWEGYDMPLAEAQACGKPAVAFAVGSHKEVIDAKTGILVKKNDIDGFAQALIKQISHAS